MNWKAVLSIIIILAIVGLILFSPKGQKYYGNYTGKFTKPVSSLISGFASKVTKKTTTSTNLQGQQLGFSLSRMEVTELKDITFNIKGQPVEAVMDTEIVKFLNTEFQVGSPTVDLAIESLQGQVSFFNSGKMKITGKAEQVKMNDLSFNNPTADLLFVGNPDSFELVSLAESRVTFADVSGSLTWDGLKGVPATLMEDHLELKNFKGGMKMEDGKVEISGTVDSIILNGVEISKG